VPNLEVASTATLYRWQQRAQQHLADLLADGAKHELPPLLWTLATNGNLVGEADSLSYTSAAERREAVKRWADHLGVPVDTVPTADGREELYAGWKDDERRTHGCFRATILVHNETPQPVNR
jgi:hypothetical protein